jgi:hypothetical protein
VGPYKLYLRQMMRTRGAAGRLTLRSAGRPACGFNLARIGAGRRLACYVRFQPWFAAPSSI